MPGKGRWSPGSQGGAIGSDLTGEVTRVTMVRWDMRLLSLIQELELVIVLHS